MHIHVLSGPSLKNKTFFKQSLWPFPTESIADMRSSIQGYSKKNLEMPPRASTDVGIFSAVLVPIVNMTAPKDCWHLRPSKLEAGMHLRYYNVP